MGHTKHRARPTSRGDGGSFGTVPALELAAAELCRHTHAACCWISVMDADVAEVLAAHARRAPPARPAGSTWKIADVPPVMQALATRRRVSLTGADDPRLTDGQRASWYGNGDGTSVVVVPLLVDGGVVGFVELADEHPRDLAARLEGEEALLGLIGEAVERQRRLAAAERRAADLALVLDADIEAQSRTAGSEQVLRVIARRLADLCRAPLVDISSVERDRLHTVVSWDRDAFHHAVEGIEYPLAAWPVTRAAVASARPETLHDLLDPRLDAKAIAEMEAWGVASLLVLPLIANGVVIGVAEVYDSEARDFVDVLDAARVLAEVAGHILDKALLVEALEARSHTMRELIELGARVGRAQDPVALAEYVAERLLSVTGAVCCEISKSERQGVRVLVSLDARPDRQDPEATKNIDLQDYPGASEAARKHELFIVETPDDPRLTDHERAMYEQWGFQSQLSIPLLVEDRLVGVIELYSEEPRDWAEHVDFCRSVGQVVAGAFNNVVLLEQLGESNAELRTLADASREFGASLDLDSVLHSVAIRMCAAGEASACDIYAIEDGRLVGLVSADRDKVDADFPGTTWELADFPLVAHAVREREPVAVADIVDDPRVGERERAEDLAWGFRSLMEFPLIHRGQVIGVAALFGREPGEFARFDLVRSLGQIAAQAIGNARVHQLLDDSARRTALVNEAGIDLATSLDLGRVLGSAARRLSQIAAATTCDIYTVEGDELRCAASVVSGSPDPQWLGRLVRLRDWRAARLAVESRSIVNVVGPDDPRLAAIRQDAGSVSTKAALIVPLVVENRVIGVAELIAADGVAAFSDQDVAGAEALCRVAALAIANAELYADLELRSREAELLNRMAAITTASLDTGDIATATVSALAGLIGFDDVCVVIDGVGEWRVVYSSLPEVDALVASMDALGTPDFLARLQEERATLVDLEKEPILRSTVGAEDPLRSALVVGLWFDERLSGALALASHRVDAFTSADRRLLARVGSQLALAFRNARLYETIKTMHVGHLKALISAMNARDSYAVGHAARVAGYMLLLGRELGWHEERLPEITEAAFLHDVGRIGVADDVLFKPGKLSDAEMAELRHHPVVSAGIIQPLFGEDMVQAIRHHHERWDGEGYPDGLEGEHIPELARALCLVDSYDAMSYQRPHHTALTYDECVDELRRCAGQQFDPDLVAAFLHVLEHLAERRALARAAALAAAERVDVAALERLTSPEDEAGPDFERLAASLRDVRDAHPPLRFLTLLRPAHDGWIMAVDPEEDPAFRSHFGDRVEGIGPLGEDVVRQEDVRNVLTLDDFGLWVSVVADLVDEHGARLGLACADIAPDDDWPTDLGLRFAEPGGTFASVIASATARLGRARVDAVTDGLTGLYNQRYFKQRLGEEVARATEQGRSLALLFCDLDHFKAFNDRFGHSAGDAALRAVANVLLRSVRQVDLAARYGGEEFTVVLIDTTAHRAAEVAERIREGVASLELDDPERRLSVSVGVAAYPRDAAIAEELIDKADWAMYLAKRHGRDRVVVFGPGEPDRPEDESRDETARRSP
jgi:diguanylate cyclase (GGDEF)-like protein